MYLFVCLEDPYNRITNYLHSAYMHTHMIINCCGQLMYVILPRFHTAFILIKNLYWYVLGGTYYNIVNGIHIQNLPTPWKDWKKMQKSVYNIALEARQVKTKTLMMDPSKFRAVRVAFVVYNCGADFGVASIFFLLSCVCCWKILLLCILSLHMHSEKKYGNNWRGFFSNLQFQILKNCVFKKAFTFLFFQERKMLCSIAAFWYSLVNWTTNTYLI